MRLALVSFTIGHSIVQLFSESCNIGRPGSQLLLGANDTCPVMMGLQSGNPFFQLVLSDLFMVELRAHLSDGPVMRERIRGRCPIRTCLGSGSEATDKQYTGHGYHPTVHDHAPVWRCAKVHQTSSSITHSWSLRAATASSIPLA
ncbi:protein of unknown function [Acidithiobacillus ferrivorans]|uniref:Uncharacterized protein n=1 Tax=Acidithiobacillus ferrivorans TaxID=160808 RepID=A0A060UL42_9PROT|nr:hypothetical protein AFERRI_30033 [Acidithiobacillus ferrivorans]SMH66320.1 protein of unknown function [Acidithiobacillus ferrivorans]